MSRLRISRALVVCLLAVSSVGTGGLACLSGQTSETAPPAVLPGYFPPGTRVVIGVRVRALIDALASQGIAHNAQERISGLLGQTPLAGLDVFRDVDEILIASTGAGQNPPSLAVITGKFDPAAFASRGKPYRNAVIVQTPEGSGQAIAFVEQGPMLAGSLPLIRGALDRGARAAALDPALAARTAELRARYDIWGAGNPLPGMKLSAAGAESLQSIDRFSFGARLGRGLEAIAELHVRSPRDMAKLSASIQLLKTMLAAQLPAGSEARLDLRAENSAIHLALSIPEETLQKAIAAQRAPQAEVARSSNLPAAPTGKTEAVQDAAGDTRRVTLPGK